MTLRERLRQVRVVSFDGDMTLWDFEKVMRHALGIALARLRERLPGPASAALTVEEMMAIRDRTESEMEGEAARLEAIRLRAFERTVAAVGRDDPALAAELNALYRAHRFADIELYADVVPTLDALALHYTLGLVSNGNGLPEWCGLPDRFVFVLFAQDVVWQGVAGVAKPDPGIFLAACQQASCEPQHMLHVGDSLASDVQGANAVGAVSVWLNREGVPNTTGIQPDLEVRSLLELVDLLGNDAPLRPRRYMEEVA